MPSSIVPKNVIIFWKSPLRTCHESVAKRTITQHALHEGSLCVHVNEYPHMQAEINITVNVSFISLIMD